MELTWLHLSDLHLAADADLRDRHAMFDALWADINRMVADGFQYDFIAFTGDIAAHGRKDEYALAAHNFFDPLLKATGVSKDRLFLVPGNHDVFRPLTKEIRNPKFQTFQTKLISSA